jgi:uncharacterized membrane protein YgcG
VPLDVRKKLTTVLVCEVVGVSLMGAVFLAVKSGIVRRLPSDDPVGIVMVIFVTGFLLCLFAPMLLVSRRRPGSLEHVGGIDLVSGSSGGDGHSHGDCGDGGGHGGGDGGGGGH